MKSGIDERACENRFRTGGCSEKIVVSGSSAWFVVQGTDFVGPWGETVWNFIEVPRIDLFVGSDMLGQNWLTCDCCYCFALVRSAATFKPVV